jgi:peptidoglycan/LPS O-acetylase OafA/YrhL
MKNKNIHRLLGVDLFRGIAAYAIVFVHSGDGSSGERVAEAASSLRLFFYFAVPFFLATSFYFVLSKSAIDTPRKFWQSRIDRLLIPYAIWTIVYLIFRSIFFVGTNQIERLWDLLKDPLAIICFGSASYQLYFIPLLFTSTFLIPISKYLQQHISRMAIALLAILSIVIYQWLLYSGNAFQLNPHTAFHSLVKTVGWDIYSLPALRFSLVQIAWLLNCLPYLLVGILILPLFDRVIRSNHAERSIAVFLLTLLFGLSGGATSIGIPGILRDIIQGYSLLLISLILSGYIKTNRWCESVGACSLGIYLIHPFAMLGVKELLPKIIPSLSQEVSVFSLLVISVMTFVISWLLIFLLKKNRWLDRYI